MLPPKKGKNKNKDSQQVVSLGIYCNAAGIQSTGIQSAEKQAQKLASQLALKEFRWDEWGSSQSKARDRSGYWIEEFDADYFNRKERNKQSQTTWDTDYNHIFKRLDPDVPTDYYPPYPLDLSTCLQRVHLEGSMD